MPKDKEARKRQRQEHQKAQRKHQKRQATRAFQEQQEVEALEATIAAGAPPPGSNPLTYEEYTPGQYASARRFDDLPISSATKTALRSAKYTSMTAVQRATIPHALAGRDVLGAAKTGSGKTLAFLVPVRARRGGPLGIRHCTCVAGG
jgi:ATP-dependent RNA helicase DDX10/DBP4